MGGMFGIREGFLPYDGDAISIFDAAWSRTKRITVMKCCIKSECLPQEHVLLFSSLLMRQRDQCDSRSGISTTELGDVQNLSLT